MSTATAPVTEPPTAPATAPTNSPNAASLYPDEDFTLKPAELTLGKSANEDGYFDWEQTCKAKIIKPPHEVKDDDYDSRVSVFLAGTIEMDFARKWQLAVEDELKDYDITILNPRREDFERGLLQRAKNPKFKQQVDWELDALDRVDLIAMWLEPQTISPISLLELGLYAKSGKLIIGCHTGFQRLGNVEIVAEREGLKDSLHLSEKDFMKAVKERLEELISKRKDTQQAEGAKKATETEQTKDSVQN